ncbi:PilZ domain-containing protein [Chitinispirillales bacterium ANBcel5]|uniref:PilZ domain-containing protein n=1 Tax=Cellulosispirillum alkaliphilum TaxID=3039283 RepID=UPI002A51723B|nr:PilZ domain-containing protein [Chitinispirillales bacterium ANBcel5]
MERRLQDRKEIDLLGLVIDDTQKTEDSVEILNINEGGMLFVGKRKKKTGSLVTITFSLPGISATFKTTALVVHCTPEWPLFRTGIQFKSLGLAERKLIRTFTNNEHQNR